MADLKELSDMTCVELDREGGRVRPGQRVAFEIDYDQFFRDPSEETEWPEPIIHLASFIRTHD
jgi:hypothetical protein